MEHIKYTAKPLTGKRFRIYKRILELRKKITHIWSSSYIEYKLTIQGKEKQYYAYGKPIDTGIITKNPKAIIFALSKKNENERRK
ncbi:MAG: hypothetical protein WC606_00420 [Candidatus Absconditabacterales bacterium]|jgi:hypothetical protein